MSALRSGTVKRVSKVPILPVTFLAHQEFHVVAAGLEREAGVVLEALLARAMRLVLIELRP